MRPESHYESWKRRRSAPEVSEDFNNRVMSALSRSFTERRATGPERFLAALLTSRLGKLALCTVGCLACAFRMLSLVALFWPR